jgi:hypothetical protein
MWTSLHRLPPGAKPTTGLYYSKGAARDFSQRTFFIKLESGTPRHRPAPPPGQYPAAVNQSSKTSQHAKSFLRRNWTTIVMTESNPVSPKPRPSLSCQPQGTCRGLSWLSSSRRAGWHYLSVLQDRCRRQRTSRSRWCGGRSFSRRRRSRSAALRLAQAPSLPGTATLKCCGTASFLVCGSG